MTSERRHRPRGPQPSEATRLRARSARRSLCWLLLAVATVGAAGAQPTVNGLYFGDGDDALYSPYATSVNGSVLYTFYDAPTTTMYVALVVNHGVNDNVCSPKANKVYTESPTMPWGGHRDCKRASDSEFATFTLECAPNSPNSWEWQQATGCAQNLADPPSSWVSDSSCGPSSPAADWPPGVETTSTTSWVQNVNTYQAAAPATRAWNLYTFGTSLTNGWKSPYLSSAPNDVTQVPGYPTYSDCLDVEPDGDCDANDLYFEWEWSVVYEWSVDLGPAGANCGDEVIVFLSGTSHHSPGKHGSEDDPFPPPPVPPNFSDWGDLPDTYATTDSAGGARHFIKVSGPYLGPSVQAESDGVPTSDATGDGSEEDGVTANVTGNWTPGSVQTFDVTIGNAPLLGALVGAWFDWNNDGDFDDPGEFFIYPSLMDGVNTLPVTVGTDFDWQVDELYARFRVFSAATEAPGGSLDQADSAGTAQDGEVEDYRYAPGALPVTLNAFHGEGTPGGEITVRWQTASETNNVGFEIWGKVDGKWQPLTGLIPSRQGSSALPQSYRTTFSSPAGLTTLRLIDYDTYGRPEQFGAFRLDRRYGRFQRARTIDWRAPRARREEALGERGFADTAQSTPAPVDRRRAAAGGAGPARWKKVVGASSARGPGLGGGRFGGGFATPAGGRTGGSSTHVAVTEDGIQRVTYEALRAAGLDLAGVPSRTIAVTFKDEPVARWVDGRARFGPGSAIEFLGRAPTGSDALYIDANLYQVSVDRWQARPAGVLGRGRVGSVSPAYLTESWIDPPSNYNHQSPTGDPWVVRTVLASPGSEAAVELDLPVAGPVVSGTSRLFVHLGSISDLPDMRDASGRPLPEHNVEVALRRPDGSVVALGTHSASDQSDWLIDVPLPPRALVAGVNQIELSFSTEYLFSLALIDRYGVRHPTPYWGPALDFAPDAGVSGYRIEGFSSPAVAAYAAAADGSLTRIATRATRSGGGWAVELRNAEAERFWVTEIPHAPAVFTTEAPSDLLSRPADLVVIAASSLVGSAALDDYVAQRADLDPVVIDVEDVYNAFGYGMALPSAITDYLAVRDAIRPFTHVQLVGADCYDRRGFISDCVSFLPLPTSRVGPSFFTPSQNRLIDLDGDGVGDKAIAQFSVRDETELETIVRKGDAWESSGLAAGSSALLIAEETDGVHDFSAQIERLRERLGWRTTEVLRMEEHPRIGTARAALSEALEAGRSLTTFSGHSSPTVWAFRALLAPSTVARLGNTDRPTLMVPLACETTYDISPSANVLGHQLLYGGDHGALAVSGAVALANIVHNERMAAHVLDGLEAGLTLGQAVLSGRRALGSEFQELQDNWITQGDVAVRFRR